MPKCVCCKKTLKYKEAYKVDLGVTETGRKRNKYYCSQAEYEESERLKKEAEYQRKKNRQDRDATYKNIMEHFPLVETTTGLPKLLFMEMNAVAEYYGWDKILEYLTNNADYINSALNKDFASDTARAKYLLAIIKSGCMKGQSSIVRAPIIKQVVDEDFTMPEPTIQPKKKMAQRRGFDDLLGDL